MSSQFASDSGSRTAERLRLMAQPIAVVVLVGAVLGWAFSQDNDEVTQRSINAPFILSLTWAHFLMSLAVALIVILVAVPLGVLLSRPWARGAAPVVIAIANWSMFAQLLRSLEVPLEEGVDPWPPDGAVPAPAQNPVVSELET